MGSAELVVIERFSSLDLQGVIYAGNEQAALLIAEHFNTLNLRHSLPIHLIFQTMWP